MDDAVGRTFSFVLTKGASMKISDPLKVQQMLERGVKSAEVLPAAYWASGHLPGAANLPLDGLEQRAQALFPDKGAPLVLYCSSETCNNSHQAEERLTAAGSTAVHVFTGGKAAWKDAGLPLEVAR